MNNKYFTNHETEDDLKLKTTLKNKNIISQQPGIGSKSNLKFKLR